MYLQEDNKFGTKKEGCLPFRFSNSLVITLQLSSSPFVRCLRKAEGGPTDASQVLESKGRAFEASKLQTDKLDFRQTFGITVSVSVLPSSCDKEREGETSRQPSRMAHGKGRRRDPLIAADAATLRTEKFRTLMGKRSVRRGFLDLSISSITLEENSF